MICFNGSDLISLKANNGLLQPRLQDDDDDDDDTGVDIDIESKKTLAIWKVLSPNFCCPPDFMTHDFQLYAKITLAFTAVTVPNDI